MHNYICLCRKGIKHLLLLWTHVEVKTRGRDKDELHAETAEAGRARRPRRPRMMEAGWRSCGGWSVSRWATLPLLHSTACTLRTGFSCGLVRTAWTTSEILRRTGTTQTTSVPMKMHLLTLRSRTGSSLATATLWSCAMIQKWKAWTTTANLKIPKTALCLNLSNFCWLKDKDCW